VRTDSIGAWFRAASPGGRPRTASRCCAPSSLRAVRIGRPAFACPRPGARRHERHES
jgi:hypothetical protein